MERILSGKTRCSDMFMGQGLCYESKNTQFFKKESKFV
jgi:hypothetical protein